MFDATTNTLTIGWDHAEGPVRQYRISYAPMTGDPITEFVSTLQKMLSANVNLALKTSRSSHEGAKSSTDVTNLRLISSS